MVELMIVVAVIAVLASIIMPKMTNARQKSYLAACKTNLRHIYQAVDMYANDNNGVRGPSSVVYLNDSCYLVTGGYTKTVKCPLNTNYYICAIYNGGWCTSYNVPAGMTLITCMSSHPGYSGQCPYIWGGQVRDRH